MKQLLIILLLLISSAVQAQVPYGLSSNPSARPTAFLDFDGQTVDDIYWRPFSGDSIIFCKPSDLTNAQMIRVFNQVAEDYRAFNINITTDSAVYFAAPITRRMRVIITPSWQWYGTSGGVAFIESFRWGLNTPCFVFDTLLRYIDKRVAEAASHEIGHTLGLYHQSQYRNVGTDSCRFVTEYFAGRGSGDIGWAPIMGNSYSRNLTLWTRGLTVGCTFPQDDIAVITSTINGTTLRADDIGNTPATARVVNSSNINTEGILSDSVDVDYFRFDLLIPGRLTLNARPYSVGLSTNSFSNISSAFNQSSNIDIELTLMRNNDTIGKYNPLTRLDATIDTLLNPGTYYVKLNAVDNVNIQKYAMLGSYTLTGAFGGSVIVPVYSLTLKAVNNTLQWEIITDEPLDKIWIESSANGYDFKTYRYINAITGITDISKENYYRLAVKTLSGELHYSKTIYTKQTAQYKLISNLINNDILINTNKAYDWILYNINGKKVANGRIMSGLNKIHVNIGKGMYVLQLIDNNQSITEKIIKQ